MTIHWPDPGPWFLAEIGTLFNQDIEVGKRLVRAVAAARDEAEMRGPFRIVLKGEILDDPNICLPLPDYDECYFPRGAGEVRENYRHLIERKTVSRDNYRRLYGLSAELGLPVCLSCYTVSGARFAVDELGAAGLKVASSNLTHVYLIGEMAKLASKHEIPLMIDTGRSSMAEIARAVDIVDRWLPRNALLIGHSPDGHPAEPDAHNLRMMGTLSAAFDGAHVGLSDHYDGETMLYIAAAGDAWVEKTVCLDPQERDQEVAYAMPVQDLARVVVECGRARLSIGRCFRNKEFTGCQAASSGMGLVAARDLHPGDRLVADDSVTFSFPARGIGAEHWETVAGWAVQGYIPAGAPMQWSQIKRCEK